MHTASTSRLVRRYVGFMGIDLKALVKSRVLYFPKGSETKWESQSVPEIMAKFESDEKG